MPYQRFRFVNEAMARPVQTECYIHILEIGAEFFGKGAYVQKCLAAIESTGGTDAENFAALKIERAEWLAVAALASDTAQEITIAGAINQGRSHTGRSAQHQWSNGGDARIREMCQGCFCPTC